MNKDYASLILGIMGLGVVLFYGEDAYLSALCGILGVVFGFLAIREGSARRGYVLTGIIAGALALILWILKTMNLFGGVL